MYFELVYQQILMNFSILSKDTE